MQHAGAQLTAAVGSTTPAHARPNATSRRPRSTATAAASDDSPESATARQAAIKDSAYSWAQYRSILFNVPNSIGWLRLLLLGAAVKLSGAAPWASLWLFAANMALDFADGVAARALNQVTSFGAVLDVLVDVLTRGWLWGVSLPPAYAALPVFLEMAAFAVTHKVAGADWKVGFFEGAPAWASAVMANGFKTLPGAAAVGGLMLCPLWAWACRYLPGSFLAAPWLGWVLIPCRLLAACVELWVVGHYMQLLLQQDIDAAAAARQAGC